MHKGPSDKSLSFHEAFFKIHTPSSPLCATEKLQFNNYNALLFQFNGSWSQEISFV